MILELHSHAMILALEGRRCHTLSHTSRWVDEYMVLPDPSPVTPGPSPAVSRLVPWTANQSYRAAGHLSLYAPCTGWLCYRQHRHHRHHRHHLPHCCCCCCYYWWWWWRWWCRVACDQGGPFSPLPCGQTGGSWQGGTRVRDDSRRSRSADSTGTVEQKLTFGVRV